MEIEFAFSDEIEATEDREGSNRKGKQKSLTPKVKVSWRPFKERNLMDSSGVDFEVGVDSGGEYGPVVSLVEQLELSNL